MLLKDTGTQVTLDEPCTSVTSCERIVSVNQEKRFVNLCGSGGSSQEPRK